MLISPFRHLIPPPPPPPPATSSEPTSQDLTLDPVDQCMSQNNVHGPHSLHDLLNQPEYNSRSLSSFIRDCENLPPLLPERIPQKVCLSSSPNSTLEILTLSCSVNNSSRFSPPASGPSPRRYQKDRTSKRRYQKPTATDFVSSRLSRQSCLFSSIAQTDDNVIKSVISDNGSTNDVHP